MEKKENSNDIELQKTQAKKFFLARDYVNAERILTSILKSENDLNDEQFLEINKMLGNLYFRTQSYKEGLKIWETLEKRFPKNIEVLNNLGIAYKSLRMYGKSIDVLEQAKSIEGETETILFNLGSTYKDAGNFESAITHFQKLVKLKPDDALAYNYLATAYLSSGDEDNAAYYYKKGLLVDQNHPYLNFNLANIYKKNKAYTEALAFYNVALKVNPNWADVLKQIAEIYVIEGKIVEAISIHKSILKTSGEDESVLLALANLHLKMNEEVEAEKYFQRALDIKKTVNPTLEYTKYLISKNEELKALQILKREKDSGSDNFECLLLYANSCLKVQDFASAKETIQVLYKKNPKSIEVLKIYGKLFSLIGDHQNSEKIFLNIIKTFPQEISLRLELAKEEIKLKDYKNAKEQLKKYITEVPRDYEARILLAQCYKELGELENAQAEYNNILKDDPKNLDAMTALSEFLQEQNKIVEVVGLADQMINLQSERSSISDLKALAKSLEIYEKATEKFNAQKTTKPRFIKEEGLPQVETLLDNRKNITEEVETFELDDEKNLNSDLNMPFDDLVELSDEEENWKADTPIDETTLKDIVDVDTPMDMLSEDENFPLLNMQARDPAFSSPANLAPSSEHESPAIKPKNNSDFQLPNVESKMEDEPEFFPSSKRATEPELDIASDLPESFHKQPKSASDEFVLPEPIPEPMDVPLPQDKNFSPGSSMPPQSPEGNSISREEELLDSLNEKLNALNLPEYSNAITDTIKNQNELLQKQADMIKSLDDQLQDFDDLLSLGKPNAKEDSALSKQNELLDSLNDKLSKLQLPEYKGDDVLPDKNELLEQQNQLLENIEEKLDAFDELLSIGKNEEQQEVEIEFDSDYDEKSERNNRLASNEAEDFSQVEIPDYIGPKEITEEPKPTLPKKVPVGKIKGPEQFETALKTISAAEMLQLFKCLRDMMVTLPEDESKRFLLSDQRLQMQYIIEKLTGTVGLRVRAIFMKMKDFLRNNDNYDDKIDMNVKTLLNHLKDLAISLPDKGFATICIQKLDNIIKNIS